MSRAARFAVAAGAAAVTIALSPAAAYAGDSGLTVRPASGPLFDVTNIFPGWTQSRDLTIANDTDAAADITIQATAIADLENGCNHPESFADVSCGDAEGELAEQVVLELYVDSDGDDQVDSSPAWTDTVRDLTTPVSLADDLAAGQSTPVRIVATLPHASGNETQTDQLGFDLRIALAGDTVVVEGARHTRTPDKGVLGSVVDHLPFTGAPVGRLVTAAGWLAGGGLLLLALARRRRPRTA